MMMVTIPSPPSCDWKGFVNALVTAANAAATAAIAVAILATTDKLTTTASQPLQDNKIAALLYSH
jgi:hypothetical protein